MLTTLLDILHIFVCVFLMLVVLLQQGKGGGMGAAFGGGATQQVFGGRGAGNILTRATAVCAGIFMLTSVSLAYVSSSGDRELKARIVEEQRKGKGNEGTKVKPPKAEAAPRPRARRTPAPGTAAALRDAPRRERVARRARAGPGASWRIGAWVLHQGFTHVSDDDYARTVIAEQFAHAPRLDPSGTSWLPLPFWLEGTAMMAAGRTLAVARAVAVVLGAASVAAPYLAMRAVGVRRVAALAATAIAMALPWNAWLGVATVPEAWSGRIVAAAVDRDGRGRRRAPGRPRRCWRRRSRRYEAWPACALMALVCAWQRRPGARAAGASSRALVVAVAGPVAWMAWNAHAHGSPLHFVARVTTFRHAMGAADVPLADKLARLPARARRRDAGGRGARGPRPRGPDEPRPPGTLAMGGGGGGRDPRLPRVGRRPGRRADAPPGPRARRGVVGARRDGRRRGGDLDRAAAATRRARARRPWPRPRQSRGARGCRRRWAASPGRGDSEERDGAGRSEGSICARARSPTRRSRRARSSTSRCSPRGEPRSDATVQPRTGEAVTDACPRVVER